MQKLSVIIPMYNSFHLMERSLKILEKYKSRDIEIIIVDDCSTDNSYKQLLQYTKKTSLDIKMVQNSSNSGPGFSRNRGIEKATGKYITFVDSDDYFREDFFSIVSEYLDGELDCLIFDYEYVDYEGKRLGGGKSIGTDNITTGYVDTKNAFVFAYGSTGGKIYKKSIIDQYNVRYGEFWRSEDMPFTKHAIAMSKKIFYLPEELYKYVQLETSLMHTTALTNEKNCQRAFSMLKASLSNIGFETELKSIELREVLNNSVQIMIMRKDSYMKVNRYVKRHYTWDHINNKYFKKYPLYVKIISFLIFFRIYPIVSVIGRYKRWRKAKKV